MKRWQFLVVVPLLVLLGACGFKPLYGSDSTSPGVVDDLASVAIPEPTDRLAQLIRNDLLSAMRPAGTGEPDRYRLDIDAKAMEDKSIEVKSADAAASRRLTVRVMASFELKDLSGGKTVYKGRTFSNVSYDDVQQSFADLQARTNAMERGAHEVALDIRTRLAAHFASR